jgi:Heterokaryon incompatibility protein (HET)
MRLLQYNDGALSLTTFFADKIPQKYAILSHTWGAEEVTFEDLQKRTCSEKAGYKKIQFCGEQARRDGLQYFWVDTCCIDKSSSAELTEAINSMFRWYRESTKCYVYLSDVSRPAVESDDLAWKAAFRTSKWFTRGWTLQELIAPTSVEFFSEEGKLLGDKSTLEGQICEIAHLPANALRGGPLSDFSITSRISWAERRETTREEDQAYSLLGIFDVYMPLIYGEGKEHAMERLQDIINKDSKSNQIVPPNAPTSIDDLRAKSQVRTRFGPTTSLTVRC